ncbi:tyrosine-type recombinase/integrase [Methanotorris igneus]|uniref:Integrase family protein n=1 Tax=Methanotorris igneus (strain DSM 5666 / JCM 11834 / Kol 5) TaxID=880724 RepID=F6BBY5_METIK|nr:tyrosine-type recombinase/integrase [Methanotorris igneus]AEF96066.1 integrase family protein [Methanotorris igneus Kol 5]
MKDNWDMELDYEEAKKQLLKLIEQYRTKKPLYQKDKIALTYLLIGLIQLRNGCRIGEAVEGLIKIIETNEKEVKVKVEKRKDNTKRKIILPKEITNNDLETVKEVIESWKGKELRRIANNASKWFLTNLKINTHSLRYAYISHLGRQQIPAQIIASITKHKNMNMIMKYTQEKIADDVLRRIG